MRSIPILEMHVAHACNLTCESCSHFSNGRHRGLVSLDEAETWIQAWKSRLCPGTFGLLGGEPTLHPQLTDFLWLVRRAWPQTSIVLSTNGFFLDRHPTLPEALRETNAVLRLTKHHSSPEYEAVFGRILQLLSEWEAGTRFAYRLEVAQDRWSRRYHGSGETVLPFEDEQPRRSWERCACKICRQLFQGRLWKCSPITYLQLQKEAYPSLSNQWDPYLAYHGLEPSCTDAELSTFLASEDEAICGMCAVHQIRFEKPNPLPVASAPR